MGSALEARRTDSQARLCDAIEAALFIRVSAGSEPFRLRLTSSAQRELMQTGRIVNVILSLN